jgi:hypothetical protein
MTIRKLEKPDWRPFLEHLSKLLEGSRAEIEAASLSIGAQVQARSLPLMGMTYDPKDDVVEVALENLDHLILKPRDIFVDEGIGNLASIDIIDADGLHQIVKLTEPLALPPPQA